MDGEETAYVPATKYDPLFPRPCLSRWAGRDGGGGPLHQLLAVVVDLVQNMLCQSSPERELSILAMLVETDLDIQQQPDVLVPLLAQVPQELVQPRHGLARLAQGPEGAYVLPVAVADPLVNAEAPLQGAILPSIIVIRFLLVHNPKMTPVPATCYVRGEGRVVRATSRGKTWQLTWDSTTTPSLVRCRSVSMAWEPAATAARKAAMEFSGYLAL